LFGWFLDFACKGMQKTSYTQTFSRKNEIPIAEGANFAGILHLHVDSKEQFFNPQIPLFCLINIDFEIFVVNL